jgi:hypothetical protein
LTYCAGRRGISLKYLHIRQISGYFKKYQNIKIPREISISLSIYQKVFENIVIVIEITIIAQPSIPGIVALLCEGESCVG